MSPRSSWLTGRGLRFRRDVSGNVATLAALVLPVCIAMIAIVVDEGSLYNERRSVQSLADISAIVASANLGRADEAVAATLRGNGIKLLVIKGRPDLSDAGNTGSVMVATVSRGHYEGVAGKTSLTRFEVDKAPLNAVRVTLKQPGTQFFTQNLMASPTIGAQAVGSTQAQASFSIGSRIASLNGGVVNAVIGSLIGGNVSLSVMDYQSLLSADIDVLTMSKALATELNLTAGTYSQVLEADTTVGQVLRAMASVSQDKTAQVALKTLATASSKTLKVPLDGALDIGSVGRLAVGTLPAGLSVKANAMDLLNAVVLAADGSKQVKINLGGSIPGLLAVTVDLAIGEPIQGSPSMRVGQLPDVVTTAQTRILLTVELLGPGGLLGTSVKLPVYAELARGEAKLTEISCLGRDRKTIQVRLAAKPGIATLRIADVNTSALDDFKGSPSFSPAKIVKLPLISVEGSAKVDISNVSATDLLFKRRDIEDGVVKSISTRDITASLTNSLIQNLDLDIKILAIGIGLPALVKTALAGVLSAATPAIDGLLYSVLGTLGARVGEADIRVSGATCGQPVLVQ